MPPPPEATIFTLKYVKSQGHGMVSMKRACHKDHACQIYWCPIFKTSEYTNMRKVKVFVTDGWMDKRRGGGRGRGDRLDLSFVFVGGGGWGWDF